jgi:DNA polymerase-3 subunit beta
MELQLDSDELGDIVGYPAAHAPARPTTPILACIVMEADAETGQLSARTYDYEVGSRAVGQALITKPGIVLVNARLLAKIIGELPKGKPVTLTQDGPRLIIKCGGATFRLETVPPADYPAQPGMPALAGSIGSDAFAAAVSQVAVAAGKDDSLPALTGVRFEIVGSTLTLVATDRYRLAIRELDWTGTSPDTDIAVTVPAKLLASTTRALTGGAEVQIHLDGGGDGKRAGLIGFTGPSRQTTTRLIDGEFPRYRALLPDTFNATADVDAAAIVSAVKRVALVAENNTPVRLTFSTGRLLLEAGQPDGESASEEIGADYDGGGEYPAEFHVAFNPDYLIDGAEATGSDTAHFDLTTPTKPSVITSKTDGVPDFRYIIMPIRHAG